MERVDEPRKGGVATVERKTRIGSIALFVGIVLGVAAASLLGGPPAAPFSIEPAYSVASIPGLLIPRTLPTRSPNFADRNFFIRGGDICGGSVVCNEVETTRLFIKTVDQELLMTGLLNALIAKGTLTSAEARKIIDDARAFDYR